MVELTKHKNENICYGKSANVTCGICFRWCGVSTEFLGAIGVLCSALFAVLSRDTLSAGLAGLSITYALQVLNEYTFCIQIIIKVISDFVFEL